MFNAAPSAGKLAGRKEWIALCILCLPLMVVSMDVSVLFFAAPAIAADLQPTATEQLWIFDVYGFILAGLLLTMGAIGDRIGRRRLLMIGSIGFALCSLFAAYAHTPETLILARGILGIAGSTLMPSTLALVRTMFQDQTQRTKAMSIWSAVMASGVTVGPIIGGLLIDSFSWGAVFLINIPAMALLLLIAPFLLPESRSTVRNRIDMVSSILALAAILPVTYGVKTIAENGWTVIPAILLAAGLLVGVLFVRRQLAISNPLIDIRALKDRRTGGSILVNLIAMFTLMASALINTQFLQSVLGYSPFVASLWSVLPSIAVGAAAPLAAKLSLTLGRPRVMAGGFALSAIGFGILTQVRVDGFSPLLIMLVGAGLVAAGIVSVVTLVTDYVLGVTPADRAGAVGGLLETSSELGGAFGIALLGCVLAAIYRHTVTPHLPSGLSTDAAQAAEQTIAGAAAAAQHLPADTALQVIDASRDAFMTAMHVTCLVSGIILLLTTAATVVLLRDKRPAVNAAS
ncbi:DHA2 family multidrug resistance protein-like MFS transporter [Paenibacillus cellulosilyticus]|uniref:DHA2 family multidrug resistance protein-like MFS transporter n=1 Tax=Paenibacillus cellulosilyticus TaxID=375489 RepID=A0A2V2Z0D2_9BACL|nr:MFS transporter [Paenibacillus cellulosilyticus]PWW08728.1 DHA2 family multidrug resistance protein-like MFS transporter [Paenibacillus cellulosilyticus]QKS48292.1 MFS transporter [Paenibacillus cellulosilyticus]